MIEQADEVGGQLNIFKLSGSFQAGSATSMAALTFVVEIVRGLVVSAAVSGISLNGSTSVVTTGVLGSDFSAHIRGFIIIELFEVFVVSVVLGVVSVFESV